MSNGITYAIMGSNIDKGMKSKGSKSLIEFNKIKLLDYQIYQINLNKTKVFFMLQQKRKCPFHIW